MYIPDVPKRKVIPTMPNWVMNQLTCIFQKKEEYNAFKEKAKIESLYDSFFPMPLVLEGTLSPHRNPNDFIEKVNQTKGTKFITLEGITLAGDEWDAQMARQILQNIKAFEETGYTNWYDWCSTNWGVKWDASNCTSKELPDFNTVIFEFDSPWGTPENFVIELSRMYPDATFEMISGSIENDSHYEFTCTHGKYQETCFYENFKDAVLDGKWGGAGNWECLFEDKEV